MKTLFFIVNQDVGDGSAHALYCLRHCWSMASTRPDRIVRLIYPAGQKPKEVLTVANFPPLPNLFLHALPSIRRKKGRFGLTVNIIYYVVAAFFLKYHASSKDILATASFPKLYRFLLNFKKIFGFRFVYEVHDLESLVDKPDIKMMDLQDEILGRTDTIITTTESLAQILKAKKSMRKVYNLGLATSFSPDEIPDKKVSIPPENKENFFIAVAYIGSFYQEQGVDWLLKSWPAIAENVSCTLILHIIGGNKKDVERLRKMLPREKKAGVVFHGYIPPPKLPHILSQIDLLLIPTLNAGNRPLVAITKAYDYLGLNRAIVAADIPSIKEILRPGKDAVYFNSGDAKSLATSLEQFIDNPEWFSLYPASCRERVKQFSWEARSNNWWDCIEK
jgi:glycosyltransferase involved in cell wall biosynthesis